MGAAAGSENDAGHVLRLLARAQGYRVVARDGTRIGSFIGVTERAEGREPRIAVRHDGVFRWRRRVLPLAVVARLLPERRLVVLNVDKRAFDQVAASSGSRETSTVSEEHPPETAEWSRLIGHYVPPAPSEGEQSASEGEQSDAHDHDTVGGSPTEGAAETLPVASGDERGPEQTEHHLRFVSTAHGYVLVEWEGRPPPLGTEVEASEFGTFVVVKLGPSPLPNDARVCAYLERVK